MAPKPKVKQALAAELAKFDSDKFEDVTHALALACVLLGQAVDKKDLPRGFASRVAKAAALVSSESVEVQKNAIAFLTAVMKNVQDGLDYVDEITMMARLCKVIDESIARSGAESIILNALYCLAEVALTPACFESFLQREITTVVGITRSSDQQLQEASLHVLCSCLSADRAKTGPPLKDAGGIAAAAQLLGSSVADIQVRAEMMLGMLVARDTDAQIALAREEHAVQQLVDIMRLSADEDARALARDLFSTLIANEGARAHVEQALRAGVAGGA